MERRDGLTQLPDRAEFDAHLASAFDEAVRAQEPLSVVMADVDHFKKVNDSHGHQTGDAVLREVAERLARVARRKGEVFRYGGEEITFVLPNHTAAEAAIVAERARRSVESEPIQSIAVSMSFGVASYVEHAGSPNDLVAAADKALYDAKHRGRNLVRIFGEPEQTQAGPREPDRKAPEPGALSDDQKSDLRKRHLRGERIRCPKDDAFLEVHDATTIGSIGRCFLVMCPACGLEALLGNR